MTPPRSSAYRPVLRRTGTFRRSFAREAFVHSVSGRNILDGQSLILGSIALSKNFQLPEGVRLQLGNADP